MRRAFIVAVFATLVACTASNIQKAQEVAALVKENCHIAVNIADVAAALSAANPAITGVAAMARAICSQAQATGETGALDHYRGLIVDGPWLKLAHYEYAQVEQPEPPPLPNPDPPVVDEPPATEPEPVPLPEPKPADDCVATVNGVCIRKEEMN